MLRRLFSLSLLFLIACSAGITSTTPATVPVSLSSTLPSKPISIPSPTPFGVQNDDTSIYILLDASYSSGNFQETRNQIAGFFYTLATRYLGISPQVYSFGGQKNDVLTKIDGYSGIQELKSSSNLGDFYSEAIQKGWEYLQNETKPRRFLIILVEGSFYSDQEKEKLRQKVNDIVKNLREADSIYFLVMNNSQWKWWEDELCCINHTHVLDASDFSDNTKSDDTKKVAMYESIKEVAREIFGEGIQWLFSGEWVTIPANSSPHQLSAVLFNPKDNVEIELGGGGSEALSGNFGEENFRRSTFEGKVPARLRLTSPSGLAAYWTTSINPFQIENLSIHRKNCSHTKKCVEIIVTFSTYSDALRYTPILTAENGKFGNNAGIRPLGGDKYSIEFKWESESESEPKNIQFSVEGAHSNLVFGPIPIIPYPLVMAVDSNQENQYRIINVHFWFLPQDRPEVKKIFADKTTGGSNCEKSSTVDYETKTTQDTPASHWNYQNESTIRIWLLNADMCNIQGAMIIFPVEKVGFKCIIGKEECSEFSMEEKR